MFRGYESRLDIIDKWGTVSISDHYFCHRLVCSPSGSQFSHRCRHLPWWWALDLADFFSVRWYCYRTWFAEIALRMLLSLLLSSLLCCSCSCPCCVFSIALLFPSAKMGCAKQGYVLVCIYNLWVVLFVWIACVGRFACHKHMLKIASASPVPFPCW